MKGKWFNRSYTASHLLNRLNEKKILETSSNIGKNKWRDLEARVKQPLHHKISLGEALLHSDC